jgi:hypothetical protein
MVERTIPDNLRPAPPEGGLTFAAGSPINRTSILFYLTPTRFARSRPQRKGKEGICKSRRLVVYLEQAER